MSKTIAKRRIAICEFLTTIEMSTLSTSLEFDDEESKYRGFRNEKNKTPYDMMSVIFSGSYNKGDACVSDKYIPYVITEKHGDYTVVAKENWDKYFPTIVLLQRTKTIDKSILDKYLIASTRHLKRSSSSSSSLHTPMTSKASSSSSSRPFYDCFQEDSFDSYEIKNEVMNQRENSMNDVDSFESYKSNNVVTNQKENTNNEFKSFSLFMNENDKTNIEVVPVNAADNSAVYEYTISNNSSDRTGYTIVKKSDNSELELEIDMTTTLLNPRIFKGACGTHRWKAYQDFNVPDKLYIQIGDSVVVKGITEKFKIHIIDPKYFTNEIVNMPMNTFTVKADIFTSVAVLALSPESL